MHYNQRKLGRSLGLPESHGTIVRRCVRRRVGQLLLSPCTCRQQGSAYMNSRGGCELWLPSWTPDAGADCCCCCHLAKNSVNGCHQPHLPRSQHGLSLLRVLWSRTNIPRNEDGPLLLKRTLWPGTNHCSHLPGVHDTLSPPTVPRLVANFPKDWRLAAANARDPWLGGNHWRASLGASTRTPPIKGTTASIGRGKRQQASKPKTALKSKTKIESTQVTQGHCCSVTHWCLTLWDPMDCSMPSFPVLHYPKELVKLMSIESMLSSNHLILCQLLLLPSIFPSISRLNESALHIRWPKYWSFSFSISLPSEYSWLISFRMD